jgi:molecular chaperone HtpG
MASKSERIPFQVEVGRIIEVLAKQIYQSPLALLRENTQNAFDAVLLRRYAGQEFEPRIDITITPEEIAIEDNGIGMTPDDLRSHFWKAGSSSKNTNEARAAGVVGTFGIGAMANFGIADELSIETESATSLERTVSSAKKDTLSTTEDCILLETREGRGSPGTRVTAHIPPGTNFDVGEAVAYINEFVAYVDVPVRVNGALISDQDIGRAVQQFDGAEFALDEIELSSGMSADITFHFAKTGEVSVALGNLFFQGERLSGAMYLRQGATSLRTFRSGFGLATITVTSAYSFGGVANFTALVPTAGREALTTESMQLLQSVVAGVDGLVSLQLADRPEADMNTNFMQWIRNHGRYDLCDNVTARIEPGNRRIALSWLKANTVNRPALVYEGNDPAIISAAGTDDTPLVVLAREQPRRQCEIEYLKRYCKTEPVTDSPKVLAEKHRKAWSIEEQALVFRVTTILTTDYFFTTVVSLGELSHNLPIVVDDSTKPVTIVLDPSAQTFRVVAELYRSDIDAFGSMVKDFVRNMVFPRIADFVPSSTRQGAEAFLKTIRRTNDVFEYEWDDLDSLNAIWTNYLEGNITVDEAAKRSTQFVQRNIQVVDSSAAVRDVVPDVLANEDATGSSDSLIGPAPPILRTDVSSDAKLLTITPDESAVKGYRCFIALSDRTREERGDFFLQPHSTSIVWGGQKVLFVFEHHSGEFGLYYDLQTPKVVSPESGGGAFPTASIVLANRIYIPIPDAVAASFIPKQGERMRIEVRCDLLYTESR